MRSILLTLSTFLLLQTIAGQYYLRGELKDEQGNGIQGARIALSSKGVYPFYTGSGGAFGLPTNVKVDTITFMMAGYDTLKTAVITSQYGNFVLQTQRLKKGPALYLASKTMNLAPTYDEATDQPGELYSSLIENPFVAVKDHEATTIGLNISKGSYGNVRRSLNSKEKPAVDIVKIEEMLNYFNFKSKDLSRTDKAFSYFTQITPCPWNAQNQLFFVNIAANKIDLDKTPPANLVFLIDASGSMDMPNRLPLLKVAFKLLTENLRSNDLVSIVTYGDVVTELLPATRGEEKQRIIEAIEGLRPNGETPGASAIRTAYRVARTNFKPHGNNKIILATDGDFNVGTATEKELETLIENEAKGGISLTCLGVGMEDNREPKLENYAKKGKGNYAYLDDESDSEKILVEEFAQKPYAIANNVSLDVKFNPSLVKNYRLLGFDNKKRAAENKESKLDGGEVGSGQTILAAFEITPATNTNEGVIADLQLHYNLTGKTEQQNLQFKAKNNFLPFEKTDPFYKLASSIIGFGILLKQSDYSKDFSWDDLFSFASTAVTPENLLEKEYIDLIGKARKIYPSRRKKSVAKTP